MSRPRSRGHLDRLVNDWADNVLKVQRTEAKQLIGFSVLGHILEGVNSKHDSNIFAIKVGTGLTIRFGTKVRATRDIDALTTIDLALAMELLNNELKIGWEGFTGTVMKRRAIARAEIDPLPEGCKIKLEYKNKSFCTIIFEISHSSKNLDEITDRVTSSIDLTPVELGSDTSFLILNAFYQVAQKIHACTRIHKDRENPRINDIYDILLFEQLICSDLASAKQACIETFKERDTHTWPPELNPPTSWPQKWEELEFTFNPLPYEQSLSKVKQLITDISKS